MRRLCLLLALSAGGCRAAAPPPPPAPSRLVVAYPAGATVRYSYASGDEFNTSILRNAYEPLVDIGKDLNIRPCLAESWHSPDDHTWVFRIRAGVRFHDGRILTAGHVADYLRKSTEDPRSRRVIPIAALEAPDDRTLVMRTTQPSGMLHTYLNALFVALPGARPEDPPVGTGRYRPTRWEKDGEIALEAFDGHRDGPPAIRELEFRVARTAEERLRMVQSGAAHLAIDVPGSAIGTKGGPRTAAVPGLRVVLVGLNSLPSGSGPPALRDPRVRAAIAHAIDRRRLVEGPLGGLAEVIDELVPREVFGHHGHLVARDYDPAKARRLLAAAGVPGGLRLTLDYVPARYRAIDEVAAQVVSDLRAVGIVAEPRQGDLTAFRERVQEKASALFLIGWLSVTGDAMTTLGVLAGSPGKLGGLGIYSGHSDPALDAMLARASSPITLDERKAILQRVAERVHERVAAIPLYRQHDLYAFAEGLEFTPRLDRRIRGDEVRWRAAAASR